MSRTVEDGVLAGQAPEGIGADAGQEPDLGSETSGPEVDGKGSAGGNGRGKVNHDGRCQYEPARRAAQKRAEARRVQVLSAAEECFRCNGFHNTSMSQISKCAQMSPGHIYHYFKNKEDIIRAIVQLDMEDTLAIIREKENQGGDLLEAMLASVDYGVERMSDPAKAAITLEVISEAAHNPRVAEMVRQMDALLRCEIRNMLLRGRRARGLDTADGDLEARVEVMSTIFDGLAMRAVSNPKTELADLTRVVRRALEYIASY